MGASSTPVAQRQRLIRIVSVAVLAPGILALAAPRPAPAQPGAMIDVNPGQDWVTAHGYGAGASLAFTIDTGDGTPTFVVRTADLSGNYFLDRSQHGEDIAVGHVVTVTDGTTPKVLTVVDLAITLVDPASNVVAGTAVPDATVNVWVNNPPGTGANLGTVATGGAWSVDFDAASPPFDIIGGTQASARITDPDGDATVASKSVPTISVDPGQDWVAARGFGSGADLTFTINTGDGTPTVVVRTADPSGNYFLDRSQHGEDITVGHTVTVTDGTTAKDLTVVSLAIGSVDPASNVVAGTAVAGESVNVWVNNPPSGSGANLSTFADSGGSWSVDFDTASPPFDIIGGTQANAQIADPDGDATVANKSVPTINASLSWDGIGLNNFDPGALVSLTIGDGGTTLFGPQDVAVDAQGNAWVDRDVHNVDIVAGLTFTATQGTITKTLTTVDVSITAVDAAADDVAGIAPAGAQVQVNVNDPTGGTGLQVTADGGGAWTADFSGSYDITPGASAGASVRDDDADATTFDWQPPTFSASLSWDGIGLDNFDPGALVSLTIGDGGTTLFGPQDVAVDADGNAWVDRSVHSVDIVPGLTLTATQGTITKTLVTVDVSITAVDAEADDVTGVAPPGAQVQVNVNDPTGGTGLQVIADGVTGAWTADFSGSYDITGGSSAGASVRDEDGDSTSVDWQPPAVDAYLTWDGVVASGFANGTVTFTIRDSPGGTILASGTNPTDESGQASFNRDADHDVDLVAGMEIEVSDGVTTKVLTLVALSIDTLDPANDIVSGSLPGDGEVEVCVGDGTGGTCGSATASDGTWSIDFSPFDLTVAMSANARVRDADGDSTSVDRQPPMIQVFLDYDGINGRGFAPNGTVTVEIRSAPGVNPPLFRDTAVPTDGSGSFDVEPWQHNLDLVPGMAITAIGSTRLLVIANLSIDVMDSQTDTVSGIAPANAEVALSLNGPTGQLEISDVADGSGNWSVTVAGYDIVGTTEVNARVADADGDETWISGSAPNVDANLSLDMVSTGGLFDGPVTVTIRNAAGKRLWTGPVGFLCGCVDRSVHGVDLVPGMSVSASGRTVTKTLALQSLAIDSVDAVTGMVSGTATPGAQVALALDGLWEASFVVVADEGGAWTADMSGSWLAPGVEVWAAVSDADGDRTQAARRAPRIEADLTLDKVTGCGFALDSWVGVTIGSGGGSAPTDGAGCFEFDSIQDLVPGLSVSVTAGIVTRNLTTDELTMDVDLAGDVISGSSAPWAFVDVGFGVVDEPRGDGMRVQADGSGSWIAHFAGLEPNIVISASVAGSDGDLTQVSWFADLRFGSASYTVPESAGSVTITVERIGTAHAEVGVSYATSNGTATAGSDYTATSGTLTFPDGVTSATFSVPIINDTVSGEGDEVVNITLFDPAGGAALAIPFTATITIQDDDNIAPVLTFSSAVYTVDEGGARATITVQRTGNLTLPAGVSYTTLNGTALAGLDYTATSGTLSFAAGVTTRTFEVRITDDALYEGNETLSLVLSAPTGGALLGSASPATLTIVDNELPPTLQFAQATYSILENVGSVQLVVTRAGPIGNALTVSYELVTASTTATSGADFTFVAGTLTFDKNDTSKTITIPIINDLAGESAESIVVRLVSPSGGVTLGSPVETTVVIGASDQQPDAMVGLTASPSSGDNVYNTTGADQTLSTNGPRNATTVMYFRIQNDGTDTNTVFVGGSSSPSKTTLRYFLESDGSEITSLMQSGTYQTSLATGAGVVIRAELTISNKARIGSAMDITVTATWTGDGIVQDTARATIAVSN